MLRLHTRPWNSLLKGTVLANDVLQPVNLCTQTTVVKIRRTFWASLTIFLFFFSQKYIFIPPSRCRAWKFWKGRTTVLVVHVHHYKDLKISMGPSGAKERMIRKPFKTPHCSPLDMLSKILERHFMQEQIRNAINKLRKSFFSYDRGLRGRLKKIISPVYRCQNLSVAI